MKVLRRLVVVLGLAGVLAALLQRRRAELPPQDGGWRELTGPELR